MIVTQIVNKGLASNLDVKYKGQEIKDDLFAIQIAIWNAGKEPVRREDILSDIMVVIPDGLQVLESSVVKTTRPEIAFEVRQVANDRRYRLDWRILEKDDGGVVQFLCLGDKTLAVSLIGTVVGQGNLTQDQLRQSARSWLFRSAKRSDSNPFKTNSVFVNVGWGTVVLGVLASALGVRRIYRARKAQVKADAFRTTVLLGVGCSYVVLGVLWLLVMTAESPFGF